mmetsp:Transcript_16314/g.41484  ORF Transcript_16314/g.41484 Transcript_16314/m.41484 type:complete len:311 (-) Transcript_16314:19-951(-)|eukprot:jgi/Tetstr1/429085/TSEL_019049.t1
MYGPAPPEEAPAAAAARLPSEKVASLSGHSGPVLAVRFNRAGTYCLTCGKDRTLRLWNPHKGVLVKTYTGHGYDVRDVAVNSDNSQLASCGGDRQVFQWDVASGRIIRKFAGHDGVTNSVVFSKDCSVLVSGGYDKCVKVWDCRARNFHAIQSIAPFRDSVTAVLVDGTDILAGSVDGTVRRFDVRVGAMHTDELNHPVTSIAMSHDGKCVLAGCLDSTVRLLDRGAGDLLASYTGHRHESIKMDCAFTPSDEFVLCGSEDGRIFVWDLVEETVVKRIDAHSGVVCSLAMHPTGDCLLSSSTDGTVSVWR